MKSITLGFKAFDPHELLCHFVAVEAGLYRSRALEVELVDITFIPENELPKQRVVLVAVDKPMFWLYARPGISSLGELRNQRVATFPAIAPPHHLANIIMSRAGLDVATEINLRSARDDVARLGLLKSGNVDAAVISSAVAPAKLTALGFNTLCCFGDQVRIPTTGLGIDQSYLDQEPELVRLLVDAHREGLRLIGQDLPLVGRVLQEYFEVAPEHLEATARVYQACFTRDGTTTSEIAQGAVDALAKSLGIATPVPWQKVYRFG